MCFVLQHCLLLPFISVAPYKVLSKLESDTFRNEFDTVASSITQAFQQDLQLKLWISSFVTLAVSKKSTGQGSFLDANANFLSSLWELVVLLESIRVFADTVDSR